MKHYQDRQRYVECVGLTDGLHTLRRVLCGAWKSTQPDYICFVDLEKVFIHQW